MKTLAIFLLLGLSTTCFAEGACVGFAESCELIPAAACSMQAGCNLNPTTLECTGSAFQCEIMSNQTSCTSQRGCRWKVDRRN